MSQSPDRFSPEHQQILLKLVRDCIAYGIDHGDSMTVREEDYPAELRIRRAVFVTLEIGRDLRGCMGTLDEHDVPLVCNVAWFAHVAAFSDPRFPGVTRDELKRLDIHISVLSPSESIVFKSEADLLEQIRPGVDGLILHEGHHRGTFLPSVWEKLPDKRDFLHHLKQKAGLPFDYWSPTIQIQRYTATSVPSS
jgi:AmmeMemoRadiSam system protein A